MGRSQEEDAQECRRSHSAPYMAEEIVAQLRAAKLRPEQDLEDCAEAMAEARDAEKASARLWHKVDQTFATRMVVDLVDV